MRGGTPHALFMAAGCSWGARTYVKPVLLDRLPDGNVDEVPRKRAQVQAAGGGPDALGPGGYGGLAEERAEPGARRGGREIEDVGRQVCCRGLESVVHIDASLRISATASCRQALAALRRCMLCSDACEPGPQRVSGSARVASCVRGRRACWLGLEL